MRVDSRGQRSAPPVWLERKRPIDERSLAGELMKGRAYSSTGEEVDPAAWFGHVKDHESFLVLEETMKLGTYQTAVSLLSVDYR